MGKRDLKRQDIERALVRATLEEFQDLAGSSRFLPKKEKVFARAKRDHGLRGKGYKAVSPDIWRNVRDRFRLVADLDPLKRKVQTVQNHLNIQEIRVAPTPEAIADEAARLHLAEVSPNATCFYSCGKTLADAVRAAAAAMGYGRAFTACSSVVLATEGPSAMPPNAIAMEFYRQGCMVTSLSYLLPSRVQDEFAPVFDQERRRRLRIAIEQAVFSKIEEASFLWLGIGTLDQPGSFSDHIKSIRGASDALQQFGAVGEVGFMPFSRTGLIYDDLGLGRSVEGSSENWKAMPEALLRFFHSTYVLKFPLPEQVEVIVAAGGAQKHQAILHGLRVLGRAPADGGLGGIRYLVTDAATLEFLYVQVSGSPDSVHYETFGLPQDLLARLHRESAESGAAPDELLRLALADWLDQVETRTSDVRGLTPGRRRKSG